MLKLTLDRFEYKTTEQGYTTESNKKTIVEMVVEESDSQNLIEVLRVMLPPARIYINPDDLCVRSDLS